MILRRIANPGPSARPTPEHPLPEAERRLRAAFPELWARYELLAAKRDFPPERQRRGAHRTS